MASRLRPVPRLFQQVSARRRTTAQPSSRFHRPIRIAMAPISTPPPGKYEWLVVVPDKPGTAQKRLEVRPKHFEGLKPLLESGLLKTGGAVLNDKPETEDPSEFDWYGSTLVLVAESKEEVKEILAKDIYSISGVWDVDNAKIAFRNP
ncbi:hypothetical protein F4779DRAFT_630103 [Xylariaceae sp. FL0662B]|nr:hypothetical protein F4779DRAFT_630103 [Xylariaceae sp. FL0662B]